MALSLDEAGIADNETNDRSPENDYLPCARENGFAIRMHLDAIDGIAHDVAEGVKSLPRRGAEIGGLLLGRVTSGEVVDVCVERYQRLECEHRFGPQFALHASEIENVEKAAASLSADEELTVLGYYRSNTRPEFRIEESDLEVLDRYFPDSGDLALLIQPAGPRELRAQFFVREETRDWLRAGEEFLFRGRILSALADVEPERVEPQRVVPEPAVPEPGALPAHPERARRLVPDFMPAGEEQRVPFASASIAPAPEALRETDDTRQPFLRRWWPLGGALALVGGALFFLIQSQSGEKKEAPPPVETTEPRGPVRPLGLYADPSGETWRVSWNANATTLQGARNVALFVREGDDQVRIDLTPQDLQSGTYQYQPRSEGGRTRDVTFRLEVTDAPGHLSAESFRVLQTAAPPVAAPPPQPARPVAAHPRALKKVPPVVPASIRPRIHGSIAVDIRVAIDRRGRVTSASPTVKARGGLQIFLTGRALAAAREWKFEPGPATEIIHFVFEH